MATCWHHENECDCIIRSYKWITGFYREENCEINIPNPQRIIDEWFSGDEALFNEYIKRTKNGLLKIENRTCEITWRFGINEGEEGFAKQTGRRESGYYLNGKILEFSRMLLPVEWIEIKKTVWCRLYQEDGKMNLEIAKYEQGKPDLSRLLP